MYHRQPTVICKGAGGGAMLSVNFLISFYIEFTIEVKRGWSLRVQHCMQHSYIHSKNRRINFLFSQYLWRSFVFQITLKSHTLLWACYVILHMCMCLLFQINLLVEQAFCITVKLFQCICRNPSALMKTIAANSKVWCCYCFISYMDQHRLKCAE